MEALKSSIETLDEFKALLRKYGIEYDFFKPYNEQDYPNEEVKNKVLRALKAHIISLRYDVVNEIRKNRMVNPQSVKIVDSYSYDQNNDKSLSTYIKFKFKDFPNDEMSVRISDHKNVNDKNNRNNTYFMRTTTFINNMMRFRLRTQIDAMHDYLKNQGKPKIDPVIVRQRITPRSHLKESIEDLKGHNRIAGFYHLKTNSFEMLKRGEDPTGKYDSSEYEHNVLDGSVFENQKIVRFGIENLGKITCYIESNCKEYAHRCKKAIEHQFYDIPIEVFDLEYETNGKYKYERIEISDKYINK